MRIAYIHNLELEIDSRSQKEVTALINAGHEVLFLGWNKEANKLNEKKYVHIRNIDILIENICIKVKKGKGIKENAFSLLRYEFALRKWLKKHINEYDAIHCCSMDTQLIAYSIAKKSNKKTVYDIYDDYADSHSVGGALYKIIKRIDGHLIEKADSVIICSEKRIEQMASRKANKLYIIHNTPDIYTVDDNFNIKKSDRIKIAYVGNLNEGRYVLELAKLVSEKPDFEFHCGGDGTNAPEIEALSKSSPNVFFYGRLQYEQTLSLEAQCDIIPALYDPKIKNHKYAAPNKFYESLFLGKPTIMAHDTGVDDLVKKYNTGIVTHFDIKSIAEALLEIKKEIEYWRSSEERIRSIYKDFFSWDIMRERLLEVYDQL